ncbi:MULTISPECIES: hypothetical protein [unclassified Okeania]|nr:MULTISPECIES: hypothetical protein [unclassified Okeania]
MKNNSQFISICSVIKSHIEEGVRSQPTPNPSQEGKSGVRRKEE